MIYFFRMVLYDVGHVKLNNGHFSENGRRG